MAEWIPIVNASKTSRQGVTRVRVGTNKAGPGHRLSPNLFFLLFFQDAVRQLKITSPHSGTYHIHVDKVALYHVHYKQTIGT